jgi:hypothetical protein
MTKSELVDRVLDEMDRVWGDKGLGGEPEEYAWLLTHYNVTEEEEVQWQLILQDHMGDLPVEDQEDEEVMLFLENNDAVISFLQAYLSKYKSASTIYSRRA